MPEQGKGEVEKAKSTKLNTSIQHNFEKHTYHRPNFCQHCGKILFGFYHQGYRCKNPNCGVDVHEECREVWKKILHLKLFLFQLCTIACGVDFTKFIKVVENLKKKEAKKFDENEVHEQGIEEYRKRAPKLTKEKSIKIDLSGFTLKTTLGRGGYGKVRMGFYILLITRDAGDLGGKKIGQTALRDQVG